MTLVYMLASTALSLLLLFAIFRPFEWAFPDFKQGRYEAELIGLRQTYLAQLKHVRRAPD